MDPHSTQARHRAARIMDALAAVQKAYREAVTTPTSRTPQAAGRLNVATPRARDHLRTITIGVDEAHALLRSSTPRNVRKPERKAHHELQEAMALLMERLGQIEGPTPGRDALAAARLVARKLHRWIDQAERHPVSRMVVLRQQNARSQFVRKPLIPEHPQTPPATPPAWLAARIAQTKAENSRRRRHFLSLAAVRRSPAAAAAAGAPAPAVLVPIPLIPLIPTKENTRPCTTAPTAQTTRRKR